MIKPDNNLNSGLPLPNGPFDKPLPEEFSLDGLVSIDRAIEKIALDRIHENPYPSLVVVHNDSDRLKLKGHCTQIRPLPKPQKDPVIDESEEFTRVKREKTLYSTVFMAFLEDNIAEMLNKSWIEDCVEAIINPQHILDSSPYGIQTFLGASYLEWISGVMVPIKDNPALAADLKKINDGKPNTLPEDGPSKVQWKWLQAYLKRNPDARIEKTPIQESTLNQFYHLFELIYDIQDHMHRVGVACALPLIPTLAALLQPFESVPMTGFNEESLQRINRSIDAARLESLYSDLKSKPDAPKKGGGLLLKNHLNKAKKHFSNVLSELFSKRHITPVSSDKDVIAELVKDEQHRTVYTPFAETAKIESTAAMAKIRQQITLDIARNSIFWKKDSARFQILTSSFIENIKVKIKDQIFKQYKYHSGLRFKNLIAIHLQFKANFEKAKDLFPQRFENFAKRAIEVIDDDSEFVFSHRIFQAKCPGKESCLRSFKDTQTVLKVLLPVNHEKITLVEHAGYFAHLEEAHTIPFPMLFGMARGIIDGIAVPQYPLGGPVALNKNISSDKDGYLDRNKFEASFTHYLDNLKTQINAAKGDNAALEKLMLEALALLNLSSLYESSCTTHFIGYCNQYMDKHSEAQLSKWDENYKVVLKEALIALLDGSTIQEAYEKYFECTKRSVDQFVLAKKDEIGPELRERAEFEKKVSASLERIAAIDPDSLDRVLKSINLSRTHIKLFMKLKGKAKSSGSLDAEIESLRQIYNQKPRQLTSSQNLFALFELNLGMRLEQALAYSSFKWLA